MPARHILAARYSRDALQGPLRLLTQLGVRGLQKRNERLRPGEVASHAHVADGQDAFAQVGVDIGDEGNDPIEERLANLRRWGLVSTKSLAFDPFSPVH